MSAQSLVRDNSLAERFARKLDSRDKASAEEPSRPGNAALEKTMGQTERKLGQDAQDGFGQAGSEAADLIAQLRLSAALQTPTTRGAAPSGIDPALIDRIAAQIAEVQPAAANQTALVTFPAGTIVGSATVMRGPDGGLTIRLTGLDPRVGALQADRLRTSLLSSLERRRIKTSEVTFDRDRSTDPGIQDNRESITSRVV